MTKRDIEGDGSRGQLTAAPLPERAQARTYKAMP